MQFQEKQNFKKNFFTELVASITDSTFSKDGKYIFARDFLKVKVWDIRNEHEPL